MIKLNSLTKKQKKQIFIFGTSFIVLSGSIALANRGHKINNKVEFIDVETTTGDIPTEYPKKIEINLTPTPIIESTQYPTPTPFMRVTPTTAVPYFEESQIIEPVEEETLPEKELKKQELKKEHLVVEEFKNNLKEVSSNSIQDDQPDSYKESFTMLFKNYIGTSYDESNYYSSLENLKDIVRYVYRDTEVKEKTFDELSRKNKLEVLDIALAMNSIISKTWPDRMIDEESIYSNSSNTLTTLAIYLEQLQSDYDLPNEYYVLKTDLINRKELTK